MMVVWQRLLCPILSVWAVANARRGGPALTAFLSHRNGTTFKVLEEHRDDGNDMLASR
jgi:hypothetical protein